MRVLNVLSFLIIFVLSAINLNARENPFIPTKSYIEKKEEMVDQDKYEVYQDDTVHMNKKERMDVAQKQVKTKSKKMMKKTSSKMMLKNGKHNLLSFLIVEVNDDSLTLTTHNQLLKKFDLNYKNTRKIVFDFRSSKGFYSKKADLSSYNFKDIAIGAHPNKGYYRISISVDDIPSNYDVMYEGDSIHIMKVQM